MAARSFFRWWRSSRRRRPIRNNALIQLEQLDPRNNVGSVLSLRPGSVAGAVLLGPWFSLLDTGDGAEKVSGAFSSYQGSRSAMEKASPENIPNIFSAPITVVMIDPASRESRPAREVAPSSTADEIDLEKDAKPVRGWSPDLDRLALGAGLSTPASSEALDVRDLASGAAAHEPDALARGAASLETLNSAETSSTPSSADSRATPSPAPPGRLGTSDIRLPDVTGQTQDLLHSARTRLHSLLGKDTGTFRSQLDHLGGSSHLLHSLVQSFHRDRGSALLGHGQNVLGGKARSMVAVTAGTLREQGLFAQETPHLAARFAEKGTGTFSGQPRSGSDLGKGRPEKVPVPFSHSLLPADPVLHEEDTSSFSMHETGSNATASFILDETITQNTILDAQWTDAPYGTWTRDDAGTITYHYVQTGSNPTDQSGVVTFTSHATQATTPGGPQAAGLDFGSFNRSQFWPGVTWDSTVTDIVNGSETVTVHETGNEPTDSGSLIFTADDRATASFNAHEPSSGTATFSEHIGGNDNFRFHGEATDTDAAGTTENLVVDDTSTDNFHDDGSGPVSGVASFTDHEDGPETVTVHATGTPRAGSTGDFTIDDTTSDGFNDDDQGMAEPNGTVDSESDTEHATGSDNLSARGHAVVLIAGIPLATTVTDSSSDNWTDDDQSMASTGHTSDSDHMTDAGTGADTVSVHEAGSGMLPDGTTLSITIDDNTTDRTTESDDVRATDLAHTRGTESLTEVASGSDTFGIHATGANRSGGFSTNYTIDNNAADGFTESDNENAALDASVVPDSFTDDTHGTDTITIHGTRASDDGHGNTLAYSVDDMTSDGFTFLGSARAAVSTTGGGATGTETFDDSASGGDTFSVRENGTTVDGPASVSFTVLDQSSDSFADGEHGTGDVNTLDGPDTFTDRATGMDTITANEHGTSSDAASGDTIDFMISDGANDSISRIDTGADGPSSSDDLSVDAKGSDSFDLNDSGVTHAGGVTANFVGSDHSSDSFTADDHGTTANNTDNADDKAQGGDSISVHETGNLNQPGLAVAFMLDDGANDSYNAEDVATKSLAGGNAPPTDTYTDTDRGHDTVALHETGTAQDSDNNVINFRYDQSGGGDFNGGAREITTNGALTSSLHSFTNNDGGPETYTAFEQGTHPTPLGPVSFSWSETSNDSYSNHEMRSDDGTDSLTHDANGLTSFTRHEEGPARHAMPEIDYAYLFGEIYNTFADAPGSYTYDIDSLDCFSNDDVTTDAGTTHREHHTHDTTGRSNPHNRSVWDQPNAGFPPQTARYHASHEDQFMENWGSHEVTDRTVVAGTETSNTQSGTEDESGTATVIDDHDFAVSSPDQSSDHEIQHTQSSETYVKHRNLGATPTQTWDQNGSYSNSETATGMFRGGPASASWNTTASYTHHEEDTGSGTGRQVTALAFSANFERSSNNHYVSATGTYHFDRMQHARTSLHETGSGSTFNLDVTWEGQSHSDPPDMYFPEYNYPPTMEPTRVDNVPTGPSEVAVPPNQIAFTFAAGTLREGDVLIPMHPPVNPHGTGGGVSGSWWSGLTGDYLAERFVQGLAIYTGGVSTSILTSQAFGTALNRTDQFVAGWGEGLTNGLLTRVRSSLYGELATRNHHGAVFEAGRVLGNVHSVALSFGNPCGAPAIVKYGLKGISAAQALGGSTNALENFKKGNYGTAALDLLSVPGSIATLLTKCFAAGTPLLTPSGDKPIEEFKVGDQILSRSEHDPNGPLEAERVEEVFVLQGSIYELQVAGRVIRTTAEHPFYVFKKGWITAGELREGDVLLTHDGGWVRVENFRETGQYETVYNLRVANSKTYFVGSRAWGFSVWAHNADYTRQLNLANPYQALRRNLGGSGGRAHHIIPIEPEILALGIIQRAARGGFNINGRVNGIRLSTTLHPIGSNHPVYRRAMKTVLERLDSLPLNDTQSAAALARLADKVGRRLAQRVAPLR